MDATTPTLPEVLKAAGSLPNGRPLGRALRAFLRRQQVEIQAWLRRIFSAGQIPSAAPDLSPWTAPMQEATAPLLRPALESGGRDMAKRIVMTLIENQAGGTLSPRDIFQVLHPKVDEALAKHAFTFCAETNATSRYRLDRAIKRLRIELGEGLELGEAVPKLAARVHTIFNDPLRAYTIARTEAQRAIHGGGMLAAQGSGVVTKKRWDAKSDACPKCRALAGKIVLLDEDFHYDPEAKPAYRAIPYPPYHPH